MIDGTVEPFKGEAVAKVIVNNVLVSGNEVEAAVRDGWYIKRPDGRLEITQNALAAYRAAADKVERLHSLIKEGLYNGGAVEAGILDAGVFVEKRKTPAWRAEFVKLGGDPNEVLADTLPKPFKMVRVFDPNEKADKPKGDRIAPTVDGSPIAEEPKGEGE